MLVDSTSRAIILRFVGNDFTEPSTFKEETIVTCQTARPFTFIMPSGMEL